MELLMEVVSTWWGINVLSVLCDMLRDNVEYIMESYYYEELDSD